MKFYFLHIKFDKVGTTLKYPKSFHCNFKNLSEDENEEFNITIRKHLGRVREHQGSTLGVGQFRLAIPLTNSKSFALELQNQCMLIPRWPVFYKPSRLGQVRY